jgi:ABC-type arginine transport system ATPase subunit
MDKKNKPETLAGTPPAIKEKIFSIIKKASEDGITDGRHTLWIDFAPHIAVVEKEDGYVVWLWRGCVAIKIILDREFNVLGFSVERT